LVRIIWIRVPNIFNWDLSEKFPTFKKLLFLTFSSSSSLHVQQLLHIKIEKVGVFLQKLNKLFSPKYFSRFCDFFFFFGFFPAKREKKDSTAIVRQESANAGLKNFFCLRHWWFLGKISWLYFKSGNRYWRGRLSTVDLLVLTSLDQVISIQTT
jgi:hypothetical protein